MASQVDICNRALQKVGQTRIASLSDGTVGADACSAAYDACLAALLRSHTWNCAIKRAELSAESPAPTWGRENAFVLPTDFVRLLAPYPEDNTNTRDWQIEGRRILSDEDAPLYIRYVYLIDDPNEMDALFREALSCLIAMEICEELTQSNTKKEALKSDYKDAIKEARRANAFENRSAEPPESEWISKRV